MTVSTPGVRLAALTARVPFGPGPTRGLLADVTGDAVPDCIILEPQGDAISLYVGRKNMR